MLRDLLRVSSFILAGIVGQHCFGADESFEPMFVDADLTGWVLTNTPPETWSFKDGVLYCTGKPIGEIRTEKMYQNFVMELEWRHMVPRGNAGIFVWADDITARGVPFHRGIEVQVLENEYGNTRGYSTHGDIFPIHGATMTPLNGRGGSRAFPTENRSKPSPQWNHYRIECRDGEISLAVNGKVVTRGKDCVPRKGYICLESEGGIVEYRNVRIRELPATDISPEHVAIADRGYRSLYSGLDLNGWTADDASLWKPKNWVLAFAGTADDRSRLMTEETFGDASFVVDVLLKSPASNVVINAGPAFHIDLSDQTIAAHRQKPGQWNRIEAVSEENGHWLVINGTRIRVDPSHGSSQGDAAKGPLVLETSGPVDFCNLYVAPQ